MAFAPPKKSLTPVDGPDGPVRGRLARAAVGAAGGASFDDHDGLDDDGNAILGSKHLWLVESEDAPRSPGVATVAAVSRSPGRERPRSERVDAAKGPAFAHLLRQSEHLMKRLNAAHGHLAKAFGSGKETTYMTTQLRLKSGAHALKCVAEALPVGDALLNNWDAAWGSQMHHLTRAKARAESDLETMRRHAETVLAEAEAAHAETEAYRAEIDANVDRIERAKTYAAEKEKLSTRLDAALARAEELRDANATLEAELAASRASETAAREASEAAEKTAREAIARSTADAEALATTRGELAERRAEAADATRRAEESEAAAAAAESSRAAAVAEATATRDAAVAEMEEMRREMVKMSVEVVPLRESLARELEGRAAAEKLATDASEARRLAEARATAAEETASAATARSREMEARCLAEAENARANRAECREVREAAAKKQIELQERVIALEEELRDARRGLEDARATAAAAGDVEPQMRKMEATSRRLRREMAAAERVRFAAKLAADDAESRRAAAATEGDQDALDELNARRDVVGERRDFDAMAELAGRVASMQTEMAAMRSSFAGDVNASRRRDRDGDGDGDGDENAAAGSSKAPAVSADVATEMATLRRRLEEANAHVAVLADSRDRALMESVRYASTAAAIGAAEASGGPFATPAVRSRGGPGVGLVTPAGTPRTGAGAGAEGSTSAIPASLLKARAEADRLLREAESRGREAFGKMARASAMFEAQAGRITSGVKSR